MSRGFSGKENITTALVELGVHKPLNSEMVIKMEFVGKSSNSKNNNFDAAIDYVRVIAE